MTSPLEMKKPIFYTRERERGVFFSQTNSLRCWDVINVIDFTVCRTSLIFSFTVLIFSTLICLPFVIERIGLVRWDVQQYELTGEWIFFLLSKSTILGTLSPSIMIKIQFSMTTCMKKVRYKIGNIDICMTIIFFDVVMMQITQRQNKQNSKTNMLFSLNRLHYCHLSLPDCITKDTCRPYYR